MRIPKQYGSYKVDSCPFCGKQSTTQNSQKIPVCQTHKNTELYDLKCQCGEYIDIMSGKYGPFGNCMRCGNVRFSRVLELNERKLKELGGLIPKQPETKKVASSEKPKSKLQKILSFDELKNWLNNN